jgi:hypothetical protein
LHNEELHNLYSTKYYSNQFKDDGMGGACSTRGEMRKDYKVGKPIRRRPFGRQRCSGRLILKMDIPEMGCQAMDWIQGF